MYIIWLLTFYVLQKMQVAENNIKMRFQQIWIYQEDTSHNTDKEWREIFAIYIKLHFRK